MSDEVLETLLIELETLSNLTLDGTKTSNKLPLVLSTSKEEPEKGPKIINFTDPRPSDPVSTTGGLSDPC